MSTPTSGWDLPAPVVAQWLADLGLQVMETRDLPAADDGRQDKLTVSLWLAGRASAGTKTEASKRNLERIG